MESNGAQIGCIDKSAKYKVPSQSDEWKHRSRNMTCSCCMWFVKKEREPSAYALTKELGRCRKHAPTLNGWPAVFNTDWCGDHKLDENKI